jgi:ElaB/YqjD/DUF883 family membrane-anchored ribosome-binding protein
VENPSYGTTGTNARTDEWGNEVAEKAGRLRDKVNEGIEYAADTVRDQVDNTVEYFRSRDAKRMLNDLTGYVKSHPAQALAGAVIVGFVAARLLRRS